MPWNTVETSATQGGIDPSKGVTFSRYQQDLFDEIEHGTQNIVVEAVAGSGKTFSTVNALRHVPPGKSSLFGAFNKSIATELQSRLPRTVMCKTINAIGHGALVKYFGGRIELDDRKYKTLAKDVVADMGIMFRKPQESRKAVDQIVSFAQSTLADYNNDEELALMCEKFNIEIPDDERGASQADFFVIARDTLNRGIQMAKEEHVISFNDQIWLPIILGARPPYYDYVFIDECQDLSKAKLELVLMIEAERYIFVGDQHQSIYGFAGADPSSFQNIIDRLNAKVMPLSICYRCPKSHVELAKEIVPHIEARDDAPEGIVEQIKYKNVFGKAQSGDLIICRFTAPLIRLCIQFIKNRVAARVKGRDLGDALCRFAREALVKAGLPYEMMPEALERLVEQQVAKLAKREDTEGLIQAIKDKAAGVLACFEEFDTCKTLQALETAIQSIFSDEGGVIELSTMHRAKGLEAENVFILGHELLPMQWNKQAAWQLEQEINIEYVAKTRAKNALYLVNLPARFGGEG